MKTQKRILLVICLIFISRFLFGQPYQEWKLEQTYQIRKDFTWESLFSGGEITRYVYLNYPEFTTHAYINKSSNIRELKENFREDVANFATKSKYGELPLKSYIKQAPVNGMIILHQGKIVFEAYPRMLPTDKHLSASVSKPFASTLLSILENRNLIDADSPISKYLPEFVNTDWEHISVRDILDMSASGCSDLDPSSIECWNKVIQEIFVKSWSDFTYPHSIDFISTTPVLSSPGKNFYYSNVNTMILGYLVERISGLQYSNFLEQEIWQAMGAEADAMMATSPRGDAAVFMGISCTLRDLARFGWLFTPSGRSGEYNIISTDYLSKISNGRPEILSSGRTILDFYDSTTEQLLDGESPSHNAYQWDCVMPDGDFYKHGLSGQGLYISPSRDLVIAFFGTANAENQTHELPRISRQLVKSGIFNL